jgi:hypothetical protein
MRSSISLLLAATLTCSAASNVAAPASWDALFPTADATPRVLAPDVLCTGDERCTS